MAGRAADHHLVVAAADADGGIAGQGLPEAGAGVQRGAGLVEIGRQQVAAEPDPAAVRRPAAGQDLEQRRLARAVRPDERHPLAPLDAEREVAQDRAAAVGLADLLDLGHQLAGGLGRGQGHLRGAGALDLGAAFGAQVGEAPDAALVALAPGRDALDRPAALGLDEAVELVAGGVLFLEGLVAPFLEGREAAVEAAGDAAVDPDRPVGQGAQEGAVVADGDEGPAALAQMRLEPGDGGDVEVVRRLVEQHQVRRLGDDPGQRRAPPLAAGGLGRRGRGAQADALDRHLRPPALGFGQALRHIGAEARPGREVGVLRHVADAEPRPDEAGAAIRGDEPGHDLHQGRLARAVPADQRHPFTRMHGKIDAREDRVAAEGEGYVRKGEDGGLGHWRELRPRPAAVKACPAPGQQAGVWTPTTQAVDPVSVSGAADAPVRRGGSFGRRRQPCRARWLVSRRGPCQTLRHAR